MAHTESKHINYPSFYHDCEHDFLGLFYLQDWYILCSVAMNSYISMAYLTANTKTVVTIKKQKSFPPEREWWRPHKTVQEAVAAIDLRGQKERTKTLSKLTFSHPAKLDGICCCRLAAAFFQTFDKSKDRPYLLTVTSRFNVFVFIFFFVMRGSNIIILISNTFQYHFRIFSI